MATIRLTDDIRTDKLCVVRVKNADGTPNRQWRITPEEREAFIGQVNEEARTGIKSAFPIAITRQEWWRYHGADVVVLDGNKRQFSITPLQIDTWHAKIQDNQKFLTLEQRQKGMGMEPPPGVEPGEPWKCDIKHCCKISRYAMDTGDASVEEDGSLKIVWGWTEDLHPKVLFLAKGEWEGPPFTMLVESPTREILSIRDGVMETWP